MDLAADKLQSMIRAEQIDILHRQAPVSLFATATISLLAGFVMWDMAPHATIIGWCASLLFVINVRALYLWKYLSLDEIPENTRLWEQIFFSGTLASGIIWGLAGWIFFIQNDPLYQLFIIIILFGMTVGAFVSYSVRLPVFFAFLFPVFIPLTLQLLISEELVHVVLGLMSIFFMVFLTSYSRKINSAFIESFKLRFENLEIIKDLIKQKDTVEKASKDKMHFLAAASHDLRQPLHALSMFVESLQMRISYPEVRNIVDQIKSSVAALEKLCTALLDITKLDAGTILPNMRSLSLHSIFHRLETEFTPQAVDKELVLNVHKTDLFVKSDDILLSTILQNLVSNAIRYTKTGNVEVKAIAMQDKVRITVRDTGVGIPQDQQKEVFKEFTQLDNGSHNRVTGLGLGLAIVDRLVNLIGIQLQLESTPGIGSCFSLLLPVSEPLSDMSSSSARLRKLVFNSLSGKIILCIDDEAEIRDAMQLLIRDWEATPIVVYSENEALDYIQNEKAIPDVIIADYRLANGIKGDNVITRICEQAGQSIPALIVTGDTTPERLQEIQNSGFMLLHKPVKPARLRAALDYLVRQKSSVV